MDGHPMKDKARVERALRALLVCDGEFFAAIDLSINSARGLADLTPEAMVFLSWYAIKGKEATEQHRTALCGILLLAMQRVLGQDALTEVGQVKPRHTKFSPITGCSFPSSSGVANPCKAACMLLAQHIAFVQLSEAEKKEHPAAAVLDLVYAAEAWEKLYKLKRVGGWVVRKGGMGMHIPVLVYPAIQL